MGIFFGVLSSCKTSNPVHSSGNKSTVFKESLAIDNDGNKYHLKILLDGKLWMTHNLNSNIPNSYCYDDVDKNCQGYGRLYTWESAIEGCKLLGEGWRLPTNIEWQKLTIVYGGAAGDSAAIRRKSYFTLLFSDTAGFNALLGGGRDPDGHYSRRNAHGFYWAATENDTATASFCNFANGSQAIYQQQEGEKNRAFSVRCVKNIDSLKR